MLTKKLRDIFSPKIIGVAPETPVREALEIMRKIRISCILILEEERPRGILTERAVLRLAARQEADFTSRPVREFMTGPLLTATGEMFIWEAYNLLTTNRYRHLVVVDDSGRAAGVITQSDLITNLGLEYFYGSKRVSEIMSRNLVTADEHLPLLEGLEIMTREDISCLIVVSEGEPTGIVTERDMAWLMSREAPSSDITLGQIMSSPIRAVEGSVPVREAAAIMQEQAFRRLVVLDRNGAVAGLVTQSDIVRGLEGRYMHTLRQILLEKEAAITEISRDLAEKTLYLDHILSNSMDLGIVAANPVFTVNYFNPKAEAIFGLPAEEVLGRHLSDIHAEAGVIPARFMPRIQEMDKGVSHEFEFSRKLNPDKSLHVRAKCSAIMDDSSLLVGYLIMLTDITEQKRAEETIHHLAYHDSLTGLPNRTLFEDRLGQEMAKARRHKTSLALMLMDLDRFKDVNDTLGHAAGDALLEELAGRLTGLLRESDTVARLGGDEFMFVLSDIHSEKDVHILGRKLINAVETPFTLEGQTVRVGCSIGAALFPEHGLDRETLIRQADKAMYQAKRGGGSHLALA